ncbi:hypothetical protein Tco_0665072 [Tanacetum coccineum]
MLLHGIFDACLWDCTRYFDAYFNHLRGVEKNLKYWQFVYDKGSFSISDAPESLQTVHAYNDKFKEPAYLGWDRSRLLVLYILSINNHFLELEESIQDKTPYPAPAKLGDENEDLLLRWSTDNFRDAVDWLSSNLNKLDDYVSFLVVKYRKPSKTSRRWMYYTFGAIGVSVFSLWLLCHGRLSGVVHNWVLEAKESVTGLLVDPIKQLTLANRRHKELMKLKQVQTTRDFRDAQVYKLFEDILKHSLVRIHGIQRNLQYWSAIAQVNKHFSVLYALNLLPCLLLLLFHKHGLDPTYNGVQFKLYETEPLNREGGLVKFETTKWIPPEISAKIRVLMSVRFYVHGELMIIRKCRGLHIGLKRLCSLY